MPYIGKSPQFGVRSRFYYTQSSAGGTSVSGTDDNGKTLKFSDGEFVDVMLNGVTLVADTDYNTSTANTIAGLAALSNGDVVEVVVYDTFSVADTVSAKDGGTFSGAVIANGGLSVGTIKEVTNTTTAMTIDSTGRILTPARPSFKVRRTDSSNAGHTGQVNFNAVDFNVGSHYDTSSYYFLVPITGLYSFQFVGFTASSSGGGNAAGVGVNVEIQKSSASDFSSLTIIGHSFAAITSSGSHQVLNIACIEELTAGHYVRLFVERGHIFSDESSNQQFDPMFSGFLVG